MKAIRLCFICLALCVPGNAALAQNAPAITYPDRQIRVIVPFRTGGVVDVVARLVAQKLSEAVRQPVIVENRTGAGGNIGADTVAKSAPDGYTLLLTLNTIALAPALYRNLAFDPARDLVPVVGVSSQALIMAIDPSLPPKTVQEFIEYAKARPGKIFFESSGVGNFDHLAGELFKLRAMVDMVHVPYRDNSLSLADLMAGRISTGFIGMADASLIRAGKLRALGVTSSKRVKVLPDIPTIAESGLAQYEVVNSNAIYVPAGTPGSIIAKLNEEVIKILRLPDIQVRFESLGLEAVGGTPDELATQLKTDITKWKEVVEKAGIKPVE